VLDVGNVNGERLRRDGRRRVRRAHDPRRRKGLKDKVGEIAYVWTGAKHLRETPMVAKIRVDGAKWFKGKASCVLVGNVGRVIGDMPVFPGATPDDGRLDVGLVTAKGVVEWARTAARVVASHPRHPRSWSRSPPTPWTSDWRTRWRTSSTAANGRPRSG
jgi:hypothetical protein